MPRVIRSRQAQEDLEGIFDDLDTQGSQLADRFAEMLDEGCERYANHPLMGASAEEFAQNLRHFTVWKYVVFYRPTADGDGIEIIRILHGARDLPPLFEA
ncbi:type II toxin-antitoxin system RelE/ParE family toxin [Tautonia rosea]|uniref:type II toxin-antitoxin system RelE/ParE family toxin n=1 Tax=Tautonia rosea TaxID=2728037 RepID=UPI001475CC5B|nr:type II toxin-antitoxin system RelE/ParE family toxin [Tautonia rosea]